MSYEQFLPKSHLSFNLSPSESNAVNKKVWRASTPNLIRDLDEIFFLSNSSNVDLLILRSTEPFMPSMKQFKNWEVIDCGDLNYWILGREPIKKSLDGILDFTDSKNNFGEFTSVLESSFKDYRNHYSFNPIFSHVDVPKAYIEWTINQSTKSNKEYISKILFWNGIAVAILTAEELTDFYEIQLAGVHNQHQRKGFYSNLIYEFWRLVASNSRKKVIISTQSENYRVQEAWEKLGFKKNISVHTYHLVKK